MALTPIIIEKWPEKPIILRQENDVNSRIFQIDLTDYIEEFGAGGTFGIRIQRLADGNIWTGEVESDGGIVTWTVPAAAVAKGGRGFIQFVYSIEGTLIANTPLIPTITPASIPTDENPPDPWLPWTEQIESEIAALERNKQDVLTFDQTPTADSQNPVTSGGVKAALDNKADKVMDTTPGELAALDAAGNLRNSDLLASDVSAHLANRNNPHEVTKAQVGLGNVDNTSDTNKPISTAQQTALNGKADKVAGAVANDLAALDASGNLKDAGKKLSDLQDKLTFDLTPTNGSANPVTSNGVYEALTHKAEKSVVEAIEELIPSQASSQNKLADKGFVNSSIATNTADYISNNGEPFTSVAQLEAYSGPVTNNDYAFVTGVDADGNTYYDRYKATVSGSTVTWAKEYRLNNSSFTTEQWAAIQSGITDTLVTAYNAHLLDRNNPHEVTKAQVGLGNVDNTSDANKPVSTAQQTALDGKADKVAGATADDLAALDASGNLTDSGKKLADLQDKLTFDQAPTTGSTNPVTSGGVKTALDGKADKVSGATADDLAALDTSGNLTDSGKKLADLQDKLTFDAAPTAGSTNPVTSGGVKTALDGKADKVTEATADDLAALDASGNLIDSGKKLADLQDKLTFDQTPTAASENPVTSGGVKTALDSKADKVAGAVSGDLAGLDANGNLTDSGSKPSDFEPAAFGIAQNDPEQSVFDAVIAQAAAAPLLSAVVKGKTVAVNQLVQNGDFSNGTTGWNYTGGTASVSGGVLTLTPTQTIANVSQSIPLLGHTYYLAADIQLSSATNADKVSIDARFGGGAVDFAVCSSTTSKQRLEGIKSGTANSAGYIRVLDRRTSDWGTIQISKVVFFDLSLIFTSAELTAIGTDVSALKTAWLKKYGTPLPQHIPYDAGSLKNVDGEYRLRGKNILDPSTVDLYDVTGTGTTRIGFAPVWLEAGTYTLSKGEGTNETYLTNITNGYTFDVVSPWPYTFTLTERSQILVRTGTADLQTFDLVNVQLEKGSTATTYEPYYNGGSIDCSTEPLNGVGTAADEKDYATGHGTTRTAIKDLSEFTFSYNSGWACWVLSNALPDAKLPTSNNDVINAISGGFAAVKASGYTSSHAQFTFCVNTGGALFIDNGSNTNPPTGEICYELATPVSSTETPQPLATQDGYNVLEPVSGGVQSAEVAATYVKTSGIATLINWIKAQIAAIV